MLSSPPLVLYGLSLAVGSPERQAVAEDKMLAAAKVWISLDPLGADDSPPDGVMWLRLGEPRLARAGWWRALAQATKLAPAMRTMGIKSLFPLSVLARPAAYLAARFARLPLWCSGLPALMLFLVCPLHARRQISERWDRGSRLAALLDRFHYRSQFSHMAVDGKPVEHYLTVGQYAGLDPHPLFWTRWYARRMFPALVTTPWQHFLRYGSDPNPYLLTRWYNHQTGALLHNVNPLLDLLAHHVSGTIPPDPNPLFDQKWYVSTYDCGGLHPLVNFVSGGACLPCSPFLARHPDLGLGRSGYLSAFSNAFASAPTVLPEPHTQAQTPVDGNRPRIAVCCVLTGGYDTPRAVCVPERDVDYFLFSDSLPISANGWRVIRVSPDGLNPTLHSRAIKMNLMRFLPSVESYDAVVYLDGNVELVGEISTLVHAFLRNGTALAVVPHPFRRCVYEEAAAVMLQMRAKRDLVLRAVEFLEASHYPPGNGLFEMNLFCFRPGREADAFFQRWWELYSRHGGRDQLWAPFVAWEQGLVPYPFLASGQSVRDHPAFRYYPHRL